MPMWQSVARPQTVHTRTHHSRCTCSQQPLFKALTQVQMASKACCTQSPAMPQHATMAHHTSQQPFSSLGARRVGLRQHKLPSQVAAHAAKPQPAGGSKPRINQWLQDVADSHRQMATSMGILGGKREASKSPKPGQGHVHKSTPQEPVEASSQVFASTDSNSNGSSGSQSVAAPIQEEPRVLKANPSPSPSPSRFISRSPQPARTLSSSASQPTQVPIQVPTRDELRSSDEAPEYGNEPEFEVPTDFQPIEHWSMPDQRVGPHSGLEAQDAADYEARILAAEARDSLLASIHTGSGSKSGMASDDEEVGGSTELIEAIRRGEERAISIRNAARNKAAAAKQAPAQQNPAETAGPEPTPVRTPQDTASTILKAAPSPPDVRPPAPAAAASGTPANTTAPGPAGSAKAAAMSNASEPVPAAPTQQPAVKSSSQQNGVPHRDTAGSKSVKGTQPELPEAKEAAPVPLAVAARVLASQDPTPHLSRWDSDLDDMIDAGTAAILHAADQPNRFLNTQFLEPLSADSLSLAATLLQVFGQPSADKGVPTSETSSISSLDELLTANEEALEADPQLLEVRKAMDAALAKGRLQTGEPSGPAQQQAAVISKADEDLCAALGVPAGQCLVRGESWSNVVEFVRARRPEEVGL